MLLACRPVGLSAFEAYYAGVNRRTQCGRRRAHQGMWRGDRIRAEYGFPAGPDRDFEIDHLIPLGIGGADDVRNLWPEPRRSIESEWNAEAKDRLEWKLRDLICSGALDVREAQRAVAEDWTEAHGRFVRAPGGFFPSAAGAMTPR